MKKCSYKINSDNNTLQYPDCHVESIILASECKNDLSKCYQIKSDFSSPNIFAVTTKTLLFYKKTLEKSGEIKFSNDHVLTQLVVPSGTQICLNENNKKSDFHDNSRVEMAIVKHQKNIRFDYSLSESKSIRNSNIRYKIGEIVKPEKSFYSYKDWIKNGCHDVTRESGIHVFSDESKAISYANSEVQSLKYPSCLYEYCHNDRACWQSKNTKAKRSCLYEDCF